MIKIIFITLLSILLFLISFSQSDEQKFEQVNKLQNEGKFEEALNLSSNLLRKDSGNIKYLAKTSFLYSKVGYELTNESDAMKYYKIALRLAKKAVKLDDNYDEAHYAYAVALGRISQNLGTKEKIANAKKIKSEAEKTLKLNPKHAGAYHVLGKWHQTVARFNAIEKFAMNTFYGGALEGSYEESKQYFMQAIKYEPEYILHYYELAYTYYKMEMYEPAKILLKKAINLPLKSKQDKETYEKCKNLLKKVE